MIGSDDKKVKKEWKLARTQANKFRRQQKIERRLAKAKARSIKKHGFHKKYGTKHKIKTS